MRILFFALVAFAILGCGPGNERVVGKWSGNLQLSEEDIARAPAMSYEEKEKIKRDAEGKTITLEIREDGTYTLNGFDGFPVTDTWVFEGKYIVLASSG